jgi:hypothetical protein
MKRIKTREAADILGVSPETVRLYGSEGVITPLRRFTEKRCAWFFDRDEVEAFARGGAAGAKAFREANAPKATAKRGRKIAAK